jgi:hypothetical protein
MYSLSVSWQRILARELLLRITMRSSSHFLFNIIEMQTLQNSTQLFNANYLSDLIRVRIRVRVTLLLAAYRRSVRLGAEPLETHDQNSFSQMNTCGHSPYIPSSLTRGWVCYLQLLLVLASAFSGPSPVGLVTIFYCLRFETLLFIASYDTQGYGGGIRSRLHTGTDLFQSQSRSYVTTDGQSASLPWCQAPIWGLRPDFYYCQRVAGLLMWGALSDERTGLPFTIAAGPRQLSHSLVRVPRDS